MITNKVTFAALATMAVVLAFAIAPAFVTSASAAISCQGPAGNEPPGKQGDKDKCTGKPFDRVNPSGKAPPGQN